jgi:hypothetical protein
MRVLGYVRLHKQRPVWDLQAQHGNPTAIPAGVEDVWLPDALRPVSPALLKSYWK